MAWSSLIQSSTIVDALNNSIAVAATSDVEKIALYSNAGAPAQDTAAAAYNVAPYNAGEVTGTNWAAGGVTLASGALTLVAGVGLMFDANDVSVPTTTLSLVRGCLVYDSTVTNRVVCAITFGADYSTVAGTFAITWDVLGLFQITLH